MDVTPSIAVVGPSDADAAELTRAEAVGRLLAEHGATVVCGGLGGVMEAAARGAASAGGIVVGILPGDDRRAGNVHLTVAIPTGLGEMRNALVVRAADAVIAIGGAYGTLSEVALALRTRVPVIGLETWDLPDVVVAPDPAGAVAVALELARDGWTDPSAPETEVRIAVAHDAAVAAREPGYTDPDTGCFVFTAAALTAHGTCCGSGCRHCPYGRPARP